MGENSTKIAVILADGFEEIEAITLIDILRRAGANVKIVGLSEKNICGAHGIKIEADEIFDDVFSRENINENIDACAKPLNPARDLNQDTKEQISKSTSDCSVKQTPNLDENLASNLIDAAQMEFDAILLPGGLPGAKFLAQSKKLGTVLRKFSAQGKKIGAICAAPWALASAGVLCGEFVCYPGFEKQVLSANDEFMRVQNGEKNSQICGENLQNELKFCGDKNVVINGSILTSKGPATAMEFALILVREICGEAKYNEIKSDLLF
jgi:4-methyl-5(B-hydroxyethyl)-thiazole monophosphate biosynthesis enzyme